MEDENEMVKSPKTLVVSFCIAAFLLATAIVLSSCLRQDVSSDRGGIDDTRTELADACGTLGEQAETLGGAIETVANIERAADTITLTEREDEAIIAECRGILAEIRRRGETEGSRQE